MIKWLLLLLTLIVMVCTLTWLAVNNVAGNLQEALIENANLRREVVALEEENKVYGEVFECVNLKSRLGLVTEEEKKAIQEEIWAEPTQ